jgi:hypothetical protein
MYILEKNLRQPEWAVATIPQLESRFSQPSAENTLHLQLGDICCALKCPDAEIFSRLRQLYCEFETEQMPDITIELEATDRFSRKKLEMAVSRTKYIPKHGKAFRTSSKIISGQYDSIRRFIKITGERELANPDLKINHLNRLLSLAYYTACKEKFENIPPSMFVHTCGVLRNGRGLLFTGPSGAGKTTVARLCGEQDGEVINDEMLLVSRPGRIDNRVIVRSAPMLGTFSPQRNLTAPLRCIFLLKQGSQTITSRLKESDAYLRFMRQIISPACIGQKDKRTIFTMMADFSAQVTGAIPVYELEFNLDGASLWQTVRDLERTLDKKERQ